MDDLVGNQNNDTEVDISSLFAALWRRKLWIIFWALVGLVIALVFLFLVQPTYQSDTQLLIEKRETVFTRPNDERNTPQPSDFDALSLASQVEILRSRGLLKSVAEKLELGKKAEFDPLLSDPEENGPLSSIFNLLGFASGGVADTREERVLKSLSERLTVYGVNASRVVSIEVVTREPTLSAKIANAITDEYLQVQRDDSRLNTAGASKFLEGEIEQLRERVAISERKVEDFRASADLIAVDDESTLTKQQLSETLTLLSDVSAQRTEAEAKADQILRLLNSGAALDSSSDVQDSPLIQRLREQQVALRTRIVDLQTSLLSSHPQVQAAQSQLTDLEKEISRQARLIARALEGDANVAKVRQQELEREVSRLKTATARANEQEIKLRALEREATAQRELLETYLTRFRESTARQKSEFLPVNARVISKASVPIDIHFPKAVPTVAVATFVGAFLASLFILAGELLTGRAMVKVDRQIDPRFNEKEAEIPVVHAEQDPVSVVKIDDDVDDGEEELSNILAAVERKKHTSTDPVELPQPGVENMASPNQRNPQRSDKPEAQHATDQQFAAAQSKRLRRKSGVDKKRPSFENPLYTEEEALSAIDQYLLEAVVVLPVFQNRSCADFAFQLSRKISEAGSGVVFVETGEAGFDSESNLAGMSDVLAGTTALDEAVFADPMSSIDLMLRGTSPLFDEDWQDGHVEEILDALGKRYDVSVLHEGEGPEVPYLDELAEWADILIFATNATMTRQQVASILRKQIGDIPAHAMFVGFDNDEQEEAA